MDANTVKKVAEIARIKLDESEIEEIKIELEKILNYFSKIKDLRTSESEKELYSAHETTGKLRTDEKELRVDEAEGIGREFTKKEGNYLKAPKSIK